MKKKSLKVVLQALNQIGSLSGRNAKEEVIMKAMNIPELNTLLRDTIVFAVDPFMRYNTTNVPFIEGSPIADLDKAFEFLTQLASQRGASDIAINKLAQLSSVDIETNEVFNRIVTKDLRCGLGIKTWKKYISTLPLHEVMLCIDDMDRFLKEVGDFDNICTSIKLDGARNWAVVYPNYAVHLSRNGKEYPNCDKFDKRLMIAARELVENHNFTWPVKFDGEIAPKAEYGRDFDKVMTQLRRLKDVDSSVFEFAIFDVVDENQHYTLRERYNILKSLFSVNESTSGDVYLLEHVFDYGYTCEQDIIDHLEEVTADGQEGLVIKASDSKYELKRSNSWLKVKKFYTVDLAVLRYEFGTGKNQDKVGALICSRSFSDPSMLGNSTVEVKVGSGYDDDERELFLTETPEVIEVKYQDVTAAGSLRFPVFVKVRDDLDHDTVRSIIYE